MHVEEFDDLFFSFHHHVVEHVYDDVVVLDAVPDDLLDGVVELLVVPDDLRGDLLDVVHVLVRGDDILLFWLLPNIPLSSLSNHLSFPLSSFTSPLSFLILSIIVPLSDVISRVGDD